MKKVYFITSFLLVAIIFSGCGKKVSIDEKEKVIGEYNVLDLSKDKIRIIGDKKIYKNSDVVKDSFIEKQKISNSIFKKSLVDKSIKTKTKTKTKTKKKRNIRRFKVVGEPTNFSVVRVKKI